MNILYLCDEYPPCQHGGIGSVTQTLAREIVKKGHQVSVCGFYPYYRKAETFEEDQGVNIYRRFYGNKLLLKLSKRKFSGRVFNIERDFNEYTKFLKQFIKNNKIDIIETPDFNEAFWYSGPRFINFPDFGIPMVTKLHGSFSFLGHIKKERSYNKNIYEKELFLIQNSTKVLAISEFSKKIAEDIFNYHKDIKIINNGIPLTSSVRNDGNPINIVVFAGTLAEEKGILSLIIAWDKVISQIPSARLFLYGKGSVQIRKKMNSLISNNTSGSIRIKGFVTRAELSEIYRIASCSIFPSYIESFGMTPLESMQVGCPTIFTRRASGEEIISDGITGLLIDPDNIQEIANAIIKILSDKESAEEMGRRGAEMVKKRFDISVIADKHIEFYKSILY